MSPRAGGEAAKFGERYEGRWTVGQVLRVLAGQATSLLVEDEAALARAPSSRCAGRTAAWSCTR